MRIRYREPLTAPGEPREGLFDIAEGLPSGWVCTYRLANQDGQSVIAELSIHPSGKDVPQGGLTTRILRRVRLGAHLAAISATVRGWASGGTPRKDRTTHIPAAPGRSAQVRVVFGAEDFDRDTAEGLGFSGPPRERRPGRPGRSDREFAELAEQYVDARGRGSTRPTADVARERGYDVAHIRDGIHEARERGLLTRPATKGRAGGELTPRARELLEQE